MVTKEFQCPNEDCSKWFDDSEENEYDFPCEECGSHTGVKCPHCGMTYDLVYDELEERNK